MVNIVRNLLNLEEEEFEMGTDREVSGIVYELVHVYPDRDTAKMQAYFYRLNGKYARSMKVLVGPSKGKWGTYASYVNRGD